MVTHGKHVMCDKHAVNNLHCKLVYITLRDDNDSPDRTTFS